MSMNFEQDLDPKARALIEEFFGKPVAEDNKTLLFDKLKILDSRTMAKIANEAKQPVQIELHGEDEIKTLSDGTRYRVTDRGWVKLP